MGQVHRARDRKLARVMLMGLLPIMWSAGVGADMMKRIAAPMIGGIFTSFVLEFVVSPSFTRSGNGISA
jgi:copper/silver efflux system protein